jgi:hypothetical protein
MDRRGEEAKAGADFSRSNQSEPTIQVTIGRVEVRATSQQPQTPKERSGTTVMSLNEYLRGRQKRASA